MDYKEALNEYFKLKEAFNTEMVKLKNKILNNTALSKKEKRAEYLKLKPKCVNCKRPSRQGTIFTVSFHPESDKEDSYRIFKCMCGDLAEPCNLNIEIKIGKVESLEELIHQITDEIKINKNEIINNKNKLLFGLITTETAIEQFDNNKSYINDLSSIFESYLDKYNKIFENQENKLELDDTLLQSYNVINEIKSNISKMKDTNETKYAFDAANIYITTLQPLLNKIQHLKYNQNTVYYDDATDTCRLYQRKTSIEDAEFMTSIHDVLNYDVGFKVKKTKKTKNVVQSDSNSDSDSDSEPKVIIKKRPKKGGGFKGTNNEGPEWEDPQYTKVWSELPLNLKSELKLNIPWMNEFMDACINSNENGNGNNKCKLTTPPNINIPPKLMSNGLYDFGVSIYNIAFNKQPKTLQQTYLTFYKEDPVTKMKNYKMLEDVMNNLVEKEVGYNIE